MTTKVEHEAALKAFDIFYGKDTKVVQQETKPVVQVTDPDEAARIAAYSAADRVLQHNQTETAPATNADPRAGDLVGSILALGAGGLCFWMPAPMPVVGFVVVVLALIHLITAIANNADKSPRQPAYSRSDVSNFATRKTIFDILFQR